MRIQESRKTEFQYRSPSSAFRRSGTIVRASDWAKSAPNRRPLLLSPPSSPSSEIRYNLDNSQADGYYKKGCIDLTCHGFVQVDKSTTIGFVFPQLSSSGGVQYEVPLFISKVYHLNLDE
ncbi:hypothetical protein QJS10_CPB13g00948 [Acorus calamus]|uniref:Neprosin PEP catalytic domain-containing protein n=1 Tax=Acorus calamus TaxID=4465 RepID=A0AAV9DI27_ACOCL|nr:hypothetical protein QJS10_CPB13g00948 [Acorus calamus]